MLLGFLTHAPAFHACGLGEEGIRGWIRGTTSALNAGKDGWTDGRGKQALKARTAGD
jgi:hypothetical protein